MLVIRSFQNYQLRRRCSQPPYPIRNPAFVVAAREAFPSTESHLKLALTHVNATNACCCTAITSRSPASVQPCTIRARPCGPSDCSNSRPGCLAAPRSHSLQGRSPKGFFDLPRRSRFWPSPLACSKIQGIFSPAFKPGSTFRQSCLCSPLIVVIKLY